MNEGLQISPHSTVSWGYGGGRVDLLTLSDRWGWARIHPELRRRHLSMWFSHPKTTTAGTDTDGLPILHTAMGIGGGARDPVQQRAEFLRRHTRIPIPGQPTRQFEGHTYWLKKGMAPYAPPGSSNHEDGTLEGWAAAIDAIGWHDGWQVDNAHRFSLKTFVNVGAEPWHTQPFEYPNAKRDLTAAYDKGVRLTRPLLPFDPTPDPPPSKEPDVPFFLKHPDHPELFAVCSVKHVDGKERDALIALGFDDRTDDISEATYQLLKDHSI